MAATETLRVVMDAGNATRRLDELSTARVVLKIAEQVHAAQQKAGTGKAIGPITPASITIASATGVATLGRAEPGAVAYTAPEQLGAGVGQVTLEGDRRSDVWSLGVVMWEALTHARLFEGDDAAAVQAAVRQQIIDPPATLNANIPAELSAICMRALSRDPAERYQSAKVMGAELEAVLDDAGYGDTDDKVRAFMATLGQPKRELKISTPPLMVTPAQGVGVAADTTQPTSPPEMLAPPPGSGFSTSPGVVIPRGDQPPSRSAGTPITVSRSANGTQPPPVAAAIAPPSAKHDDAPMSPTSFLKSSPPAPARDLPSVLKTPTTSTTSTNPTTPTNPGASLAAALANAAAPAKPDRTPIATMVSASIPAPAPAPAPQPQVPKPPVLPATPAETAQGFHSDQVATAAGAADSLRVTPVAPRLEAPPVIVAEIPSLVSAPLISAGSDQRAEPAPLAELKKRAGTNPDPAAVVALHGARDSQGVLGGWGWGTDSHPSLKQYDPSVTDDDELETQRSSKKILLYVIGGGLAVAAIVVVLAFAFGGSAKPAPKEQAKLTGSGSAEIIYGSGVAYGSATGDPTGGSAIAAATGSGSDATGSAVAAVDTGSAAAVVEAPAVPAVVPDAAVVATAPLPEPVQPAKPVEIEKPKPTPVVVAKPAVTAKPVAVAKPVTTRPEKKPEPAHHVEKPVEKPVEKARPFHVAEGPSSSAKADAEGAYRQGVQQFARGDTSGALTSLRAALASNPGYAPTWRGLGLVFEKMGEKDQAKAAFRRYLQLSPGASDGDQIRNRMEKM